MKKNSILTSALTLFAQRGIDGTSTRSIAENASVSEGLIFRHFRSKDGLVDAILALGIEKITPIIDQIATEHSPKQRLRNIILGLANIPEEDYPFWKFVFMLKLREDHHGGSLAHQLQPLIEKEFKALGYARADNEAQLLMCSLDGLFFKSLFEPEFSLLPYLNLIVKKYQLNS